MASGTETQSTSTNNDRLKAALQQAVSTGIPLALDAQAAFAESLLNGRGLAPDMAGTVGVGILKGLSGAASGVTGYGQAKREGYDTAGALVHGAANVVGGFLGGAGGALFGNPMAAVLLGAAGAKAGDAFADFLLKGISNNPVWLGTSQDGNGIYLTPDNKLYVDNGQSKMFVASAEDFQGNTYGVSGGKPYIATADGRVGDISVSRSSGVHSVTVPRVTVRFGSSGTPNDTGDSNLPKSPANAALTSADSIVPTNSSVRPGTGVGWPWSTATTRLSFTDGIPLSALAPAGANVAYNTNGDILAGARSGAIGWPAAPDLTNYSAGLLAPLAPSPMTAQPNQSLGSTPTPGGPFDWPQSNPTDYSWLSPPLAPSWTIPQADAVGSAGAFATPPPQTQTTPQQVPAPSPSPFGVPIPEALKPLVQHFFPQGFDTGGTQPWPSTGSLDGAGTRPNSAGSPDRADGDGALPVPPPQTQLTPQQVPAPPPSPFDVPIPPELLPLVPHFFPQGFDAATQSWPSTGILGDAGARPSPVGSAGAGLDFTRGPMTSQRASAPPVPPIDVPIPEALRPLVRLFFP